LAALAASGAPIDNVQTAGDPPPWYHPGRAGSLRLGPTVLGHFGDLHPDLLAAFDAKPPMAAFEVFLDAVPASRAKARPPLNLSVFQPVERDFAFVVDRDVAAETLLRAARGVDRNLVAEIRLFDVYEGKGLPEGKKSLAIAVTLQPQDATLTDLLDRSARVAFDLDGFGARRWTWVTTDAGWLVYDPRGTRQITSGLQLFGNVTFWLFWDTGYAALRALDDDGDGWLRDDELAGLAIWRDVNRDAVSQPDEVAALSVWGISELSVSYRSDDEDPDVLASSVAGVRFTDGSVRPTFDLILHAH